MPIDVDRLTTALADRYAIKREIGRGGMATVFLADDLKHGRQVAVKVLEPELASSLGADRFLREIETAARLNHPHILPLYDSGDADGFLFYAMPYMEGSSLRDRLDRETQLPVEDAVRIAREVAGGLDYAHEQGIVHRDIKPANIMLSRGHAVIADFGIARAVDEAGGERITKTGVSLGSPTYMSPEQAAGSKTIDGRADIYALGCVLYEMLAGEPPYAGTGSAALMARKELEAAPRLGSVRETIPPNVDRAVARALARVPADRFSTAGEFANALSQTAALPADARAVPIEVARTRSIGRTVIAGLFIVAIAATGWLLGPGSRPGPEAGGEGEGLRAIAVLPFDNRSAEGEDASFFADGLHDDLLTQLSKIEALTVISRGSVMKYRDTQLGVPEIAGELRAATVLEGRVQRAGDRVRVNVQLIDGRNDSNLWAETYDRELTAADIFSIQTEIAEHVVSALEATLTPAEQDRISAPPTDNFEAYELYLRGLQSFNRFFIRFDVSDLRETAEYLKAAIDLDPGFAQAYAKLANTFFGLGTYPDMSVEESDRLAVSTAEKALELDPTSGEAHAVLALVAERAGAYETAESEYRQAIELSPGAADVREWYADMLLQVLGRADEALLQYLRVHELNPLRVSWGLGQAYYFTRDYDGAIDYLRRALPGAPKHPFATTGMFRTLARALLEKGLYEDAIEAERRGSELAEPPTPACLDVCVIAYARSGRVKEARESLDRLIVWVEDRGGDASFWRRHEQVARVYAALGEPDLAFEWLDRDDEESGLDFTYLLLDPQWDPLRSDPRFDELLRRKGLAD